MKNWKKYWLALAGIAALTGCAVEREDPANLDEKTYFDAWLHVNHPDAEALGMGVYLLEEEASDEDDAEAVEANDYVFVTYTVSDLSGNISATSDYETAKRVGSSFDESYYYGPNVWRYADQYIYKGVQDMISGMTTGGHRRKVAIPGWLLSYRIYGSAQEYMDNVTGNSHTIYDVTIWDKAEDITKWELDSLASFNNIYLGLADSTSYGFYYKTLVPGEGEPADIRKDTTIYINYTGRLLNGQVFDTTIADTAKVWNIYDASADYAPVSITMSSEMSSITMGDDGDSVITGFSQTIWQMCPMEKGVGVFYSGLGYGSSGSSSRIPAYAPLIFEIELVEED